VGAGGVQQPVAGVPGRGRDGGATGGVSGFSGAPRTWLLMYYVLESAASTATFTRSSIAVTRGAGPRAAFVAFVSQDG